MAGEGLTILQAKLQAGEGGGSFCVVRGAVTMKIGPDEFYLQDETSGVRIVAASYRAEEGLQLEVEGWLYVADSGEFQLRPRQVSLLRAAKPVSPLLVALNAAVAGDHQGQLVAVRGTVLNVDFGKPFDTISIQADRQSLRVFYPAAGEGPSAFEKVYPGMQVAATGISVPQTADPESDRYQVRLHRPEDLEIRSTPAAVWPAPRDWALNLVGALAGAALMFLWTRQRERLLTVSPNKRLAPAPPDPFASSPGVVYETPRSEPAHPK
jgi:hypothetical protein